MTPQMEANELLKIWQRNRHRPPEQRLQEDATLSERPSERSKDSVEHQGDLK